MSMLTTIVAYADTLLRVREIDDYPGAYNGLQVENSGNVKKIAAAVDANFGTIRKAVECGAELLVVHHGLYWSGLQRLTEVWYKKADYLLKHNLAVYSVHLPLDMHPTIGNNALLCQALRLRDLQPFFFEKGHPMGLRASVEMPRKELVRKLEVILQNPVWIGKGGPEVVREIGVVTGAAGSEVARAHAEGVDTFISGEAPHHAFGLAEELGINLILGGHYATETFGVKALAQELSEQFKISWEFIDHPSGL